MDANGDMQFGHGSGDFWFNQVEGVGQSIATRLQLFRGEWFLDTSEGTPWGGFPLNEAVVAQGEILGEHTAFARDMALRSRVVQTYGVLAIVDYSSSGDPNTRSFSASMTVETIFGSLALSIRPSQSQPRFVIHYSALSGSDQL
jgi:hypothetical protein